MIAFVRVEGHYDTIYSEGLRLFPSVNTYGDHARRLPRRCATPRHRLHGHDAGPEDTGPRIQTRSPRRTRRSASAAASPTTTSSSASPAPTTYTAPRTIRAPLCEQRILDYGMRSRDARARQRGATRVLGRWLPKNVIVAMRSASTAPTRCADGSRPRRSVGLDGTAGGVYDDRSRGVASPATRSSPASPRQLAASPWTRSTPFTRPCCSRPTP